LTALGILTRIGPKASAKLRRRAVSSAIYNKREAAFLMSSEAHFLGASLAETLLGDEDPVSRLAEAVAKQKRHAVIAFVGMAFEANIAAGPDVLVFCRNARRELAEAVATAARRGCRGVISFGVAGGLDPDLRAGDCVVASAIVEAQNSRGTDPAWSSRLVDAIGPARHAPIVGVDSPIADPARKRELHMTTGAAAVDMESHVVARLAAAHALAFAALRVVVDPADRIIPRAALLGMGGNGHADGVAVVRDLMARPSQLAPLARIAVEALIARNELLRIRGLLGPCFGLVDLGAAAGATPMPAAAIP
jgi:adenosylhomocysteine nucleosidase